MAEISSLTTLGAEVHRGKERVRLEHEIWDIDGSTLRFLCYSFAMLSFFWVNLNISLMGIFFVCFEMF